MKTIFNVILFFIVPVHLIQAQVSHKLALYHLLSDSTQRIALQKKYYYFEEIDSAITANQFDLVFDKPAAYGLLNYIENTKVWGFNVENYQYSLLKELANSRKTTDNALFQIRATEIYLKLYHDILNGVLTSRDERGKDIHLDLSEFNVEQILHTLMGTKGAFLFYDAEPQTESYLKLKNTLALYYKYVELFNEVKFTFTDTLKVGSRDSSILDIRKKLYFLGDLKTKRKFRSTIFDYDLKIALQNFQQRHLLTVNGLIDEKTIDKLNTPIQEIITELQLNLERWRWLPQSLGSYYAFSNLPAYEVDLVKNDTLLLRQNMVCGKISRNTPVFSDTMVYMDMNPTWTVPPTILQNDILPAAKRSSSYLSRKNIQVLDVSTGKYISSAEINWANSRNYKFIQGPGFSNSLGIVKFIFPNPYYIFFHDTPHKEHFHLPNRAYSSGCIRLAQPLDFAEELLQFNKVPFDSLAIDSILKRGKTKRVLLDEKPMVYINYITQEYKNGLIYHYPDVYKYNGVLKEEFFKKNRVAI